MVTIEIFHRRIGGGWIWTNVLRRGGIYSLMK